MPLTSKGETILAAMKKEYGEKAGERVFYASKNAGKISDVDNEDITLAERLDNMTQQVNSLGKGAARIAERMDATSKENLIQAIMRVSDLTRGQAETAFNKLQQVKALKVDKHGGGYSLSDGRFMDRDVLRRAAGMNDSEETTERMDMSSEERVAYEQGIRVGKRNTSRSSLGNWKSSYNPSAYTYFLRGYEEGISQAESADWHEQQRNRIRR